MEVGRVIEVMLVGKVMEVSWVMLGDGGNTGKQGNGCKLGIEVMLVSIMEVW